MGEVLAAIWESPKPVVARVGGPARAGGLGLIAAADIAVCTTDATFAFTEVRIGVIPAVISATVLPRLSPRAAAELFLTGDTFDGVRAAAIGLVTSAVPAVELDAAVDAYVRSLVRGAPTALGRHETVAAARFRADPRRAGRADPGLGRLLHLRRGARGRGRVRRTARPRLGSDRPFVRHARCRTGHVQWGPEGRSDAAPGVSGQRGHPSPRLRRCGVVRPEPSASQATAIWSCRRRARW